MATKIVTKNSSTAGSAPLASDLVQGELAVNVADKRLFTEDNGGTIVEVGTNPSTLTVTGEITANGGIALGDNGKATFGASDDLQIYHDGGHSYISDTGSGNLKIKSGAGFDLQTTTGENYLDAVENGAINLYYDNSKKLATTATGIDVTGNVESDSVTIGVGAVAGTEKLRVNGTVLTLGGTAAAPAIGIGDVNTGIYAPTAGTLGWTVNGTQRLLLNSSGIDVTGSVVADGLTVVGSATSTFNSGSENLVATFTSTDTEAQINLVDTTGSAQIRSRNDLRFYVNGGSNRAMDIASNGDISFYEDTGTTAKLFWDASAESLGIGTSSPSAPLDVDRSFSVMPVSTLTVGNRRGLSIYNNQSNGFVDTTLVYGNTVNSYFAVGHHNGTSYAERMRIDSSGNVSIGSTSASGSRLRLDNGGTSGAPQLMLTATGAGTQTEIRHDTSGNLIFDYWNGGGTRSERMRIDASGNITATASGTAMKAPLLQATNGNVATYGGTTPTLHSPASATLAFSMGGSERMRIDSSGNLLVGKTATGFGTAGIELRSNGELWATTGVTNSASFNRTGSYGAVITINSANTPVGSIGTAGGGLTIGNGDTGVFFDAGNDNIRPFSLTTNNSLDAAIDLGRSTTRFKDLYLSGGVYLGGTGAANKLDDYEEGTWTPAFTFGTSGSVTYTTQAGTYRKVGSLVFVSIAFTIASVSSPTGAVTINNLPFASGSDSNFGAMTIGQVRSLVTARPDLAIYQNPSTSTLSFSTQASNAGFSQFQGSDLQAGTVLFISGCYISA